MLNTDPGMEQSPKYGTVGKYGSSKGILTSSLPLKYPVTLNRPVSNCRRFIYGSLLTSIHTNLRLQTNLHLQCSLVRGQAKGGVSFITKQTALADLQYGPQYH